MSQVRRLEQIPVATAFDTSDQIAVWQSGRTRTARLQDIINAAVTGAVPLVPVPNKAAVGLGNVDNTSDTAKTQAGNPVGDALAGKQAKTYAQAGTGAVNALVDAKLKGLYVLPEEYGTVGQGNDTAAVQLAANTGRRVLLLEHTYPVSTILLPNGSAGITGLSDKSVLLGGADGSTISNILQIGDNTADTWSVRLENFKIQSSNVRSGGSAVLWYRARQAVMDKVLVGDKKDLYAGDVPKIYNGITFIDFDSCAIDNCQIVGGVNDAIACSGPTFSAELTVTGGTQILQWGHFGILCGGNVGALKLLSGGIALCNHGLWADQSRATGVNREIFVGTQYSIDSCQQRGVYIADNGCFLFIADQLWVCSSGRNGAGAPIAGAPGVGMEISATQVNGSDFRVGQLVAYNNTGSGVVQNGGTLQIDGGGAFNNGGNGIAIAGGITETKITGVKARFNTAYGFFVDPAAVTAAKSGTKTVHLSAALAYGNTAGDSTGFSGAPAGRYSVSGSIGVPMT